MQGINIAKLKGKIAEKGISQESFAKAIGIDNSTLFRKLQLGGIKFSIEEVKKIVQVLELTKSEAMDIFLPDISQ